MQQGQSVVHEADRVSGTSTGYIGPFVVGVIWILSALPARCQSTWPSYPNNNTIIVTPGGNVGIGTPNPLTKLHVAGSNPILGVQDLMSQGSLVGMQAVGDGNIRFGYLAAAGILSNTMYLAKTGNVGIGTIAPGAKFHVSAAAPPNFEVFRLQKTGSTSPGQYGFFVQPIMSGSIADLQILPDHSSGGTSLYSRNAAGAAVFGLGVDRNGNVGIGTQKPQSRLAVNGTITTKEVVVTNIGWSDYVFKPTYRLAPLSEIKSYIQAHRHLPDIPSETEVKEKGISLGEIQAKLLAKIEELTLHMIRAEERSTLLQERNDELLDRVGRLEGELRKQ